MATRLSGQPAGYPHGIFAETTAAQINLGTQAVATDGRTYRYCQAGSGNALVVGDLQQSPVEDTAHQNLTPVAAAIGATQVTVALGNSEATANEYADGYLIVSITPGLGYQYLIKSHPAADASTNVVLTLSDPIEVALTTTSRVDMVLNPYAGVIINPQSSATGVPVVVAVTNITASSRGWIHDGGVAAVLADCAITVGTSVIASNGVDGAIEDVASTTQHIVGTAVTGIATGDVGAVKLI